MRYTPRMSLIVLWVALGISVVASLAAFVYLGLSVLHLARTSRRALAANRTAATRISQAATEASVKAAALSQNGEALGAAVAGVRAAMARLSISSNALAEASGRIMPLVAFLRRK